MSKILFDDVVPKAVELVRATSLVAPITIVRDLMGRVSIIIDDTRSGFASPSSDDVATLVERLHLDLGAYAGPRDGLIQWKSEWSDVDWRELDSQAVALSSPGREVYLVERLVTGADWYRTPAAEATTPRLTFFAIKGGVGRSSAAAAVAVALARLERKVLVLDLDLESPGIGSLLLQPEVWPSFGIVDHLVESAVGQGDAIVEQICAHSPAATLNRLGGSIVVAPASGRASSNNDYLGKLSRTSLELTSGGVGTRLLATISALENIYRPDVTIVDSRSGLHDVAAAAVTQLGATSLLFAANNDQTWEGYRMLFEKWCSMPSVLRAIRERVQIVGARLPSQEAIEPLRDRAYDCFVDYVYDEQGPGELDNGVSFDLTDEAAPHSPWPVFTVPSVEQWNPCKDPLPNPPVEIAFGALVASTTALLEQISG